MIRASLSLMTSKMSFMASFAVDFPIWSIVQRQRVQPFVATNTSWAGLMKRFSFGIKGFSMKHCSSTSKARYISLHFDCLWITYQIIPRKRKVVVESYIFCIVINVLFILFFVFGLKKKRKKIMQLKWPKYQKPKEKNMGWMKYKWTFFTIA